MSQTPGWDAITVCYSAVLNSAELDLGTSPKAWRSSNGRELAKQLPYPSLQPPCWGRHKQGEERAKSTACFIPAHPQPSQQALAATGSQDQQRQPGCYKLQWGTSPATRFIAQDQGSTATASTLLWAALPAAGPWWKTRASMQELNASSTRQLMIYSESHKQ